MNGKNLFKNAVIKQAKKLKETNIMKQIEKTFNHYTFNPEKHYNHCSNPECLCCAKFEMVKQPVAYGCRVGKYSFGSNAEDIKMGRFSYWPTATNDGTLTATAHIVHIN